MKVDLLAIGVHPDDVELSSSGTIINEIRAGKKVAVIDMTQGELGTRGNAETRYQEAAQAAMILGVHARENLKMRDGFFEDDETNRMLLIQAIRKYRPEIILANALEDRHPDHGRAGKLIETSCFLSGLSKIITKDDAGNEQEKWKPSYVLHYIQDTFREPDIIIDITDSFDQRMKAISAYSTQFFTPNDKSGEPQTYISSPEFFESVTARARMIGKRIGVKFAEGFNTEKTIGIRSLDSLISIPT
jgi:bacillithiol biosynthesis deacetylase BshB1